MSYSQARYGRGRVSLFFTEGRDCSVRVLSRGLEASGGWWVVGEELGRIIR